MKIGTIIRVVLATSVLTIAIWFVFRGVDIEAMISILTRSNMALLLLSLPIVIASHVVRARRWQTLLIPSGHTTHISTAFNAVMIGYAANMFVPRSGEFIRPWVFSRRESIPVGTALSSVLIERVLDVLSLLIGISCVMFFAPGRFAEILPGFTASGIVLRLGLPIGLLAV
ncbi:MAG: lysylphosphatidylglycerol synthase transmembrane domain-containing protein, partial [Candidatus Kapabacteria bacterium]|nr:lysylphosphatidylglycerol synthase transmembrane domain-containing protein [Candidatus Kapabacteria bacterium]